MDELDYKICHECGEKMFPRLIRQAFSYHGDEITIPDVKAYVCGACGEIVLSGAEARRIERLLRGKRNPDPLELLNLRETASLLGVSRQTVYNMVHDGRLRARKIGREWRFLRGELEAFLRGSADAPKQDL